MNDMNHLTDSEVLKRCVRKAVENGWGTVGEYILGFITRRHETATGAAVQIEETRRMIPGIIFSHDFAQALWGEENTHDKLLSIPMSCNGDCYGKCHFDGPEWQYHIQQLALSTDRIGYLREHGGI